MFKTHSEGTTGSANCALRHLYIEWRNNYISIEKFAANNNIDLDIARMIIDKGRIYHDIYCQYSFESAEADL
jgi:hypothetical protein